MSKAVYACKPYLTVVLLAAIYGCSESISDPADKIDGQKPGTELTDFLPFVTNTYSNGVNTAAAYSFVDVNNPSANVRVINHTDGTAEIMPARFFTGVPDTQNLALSNDKSVVVKGHHLDTFLYKKNGHIYKVDVSNVYSPESIQLSTESQAHNICHDWDWWADDYVDSLKSRYVYYVAADCGSAFGEWRMIRLGTAAVEFPLSLSANIDYIVTYIHNQLTGALVGWLVVEKNINNVSTLVRYDADFQNPQLINVQVAEFMQSLAFTPDGKILLANDNQLIFYSDVQGSREVVEIQTVFFAGEQKKITAKYSIGGNLYFLVKNEENLPAITTTINRISLESAFDGTFSGAFESASELAFVNGNVDRFEVSDKYLLYAHDGQLTRLDLNTFESKNLLIPSGYLLEPNNRDINLYAVADYLFVELVKENDNSQRMVWVINDSKQIDHLLVDHYLVGAIYDDELHYSANTKINSLIFESGINSGDRALHMLKPDNYPAMIKLGTLPGGGNEKILKRYFANGHKKGLLESSVGALREIFYFDADKENSLKQITNDNVNHSVINH